MLRNQLRTQGQAATKGAAEDAPTLWSCFP